MQRTARQREAIDAWLLRLASDNTRTAYRSDLEVFAAWCAQHRAVVLTADTDTLVAFQRARAEAGDSAATIRRRWSALSSFYDFAVEERLRSANPSHGVERPRVTPGDPSPTVRLHEHDVAGYRLAAAAIDPRLDALVSLLVLDGLKVAEALALDIAHLSLRAPATIDVVRRGAVTRVAVHLDTARALRRCIAGRTTGPVFVSERMSSPSEPQRLSRFGADHLIRRLRTDGASPVTANALRRFHITARRVAGDDLDEVRDRAGLADVRSVRRYLLE